MGTIKKARNTISIAPDSPQLKLYRFYIEMGGRQLPRENLCHYFWAITFWPFFYFITRKKVVKDMTILHILWLVFIISMFIVGIVLQPLVVVAMVGIGLFFYNFGGPIVGLIERIVEWYQSNYNYKLMATKITITVGIVFAICSRLFGFDTSWTALKMILASLAILAVLFGTVIGFVLTIVYMVEKVQRLKKSRAAKMKAARASSPDIEMANAVQKQGDSVFRIIWMYLKTLKENYLCPFIEIPEDAIRPRTSTYYS